MARSATKILVTCLLLVSAFQGLDAAPRRLKQISGLPNIPDLDGLLSQLQGIFPGLDLQTLVSMIESGQFGAIPSPTPTATPTPTTAATPTPTTAATPTPTTAATPTPTTPTPPTPTTTTTTPPTPSTPAATPPSDAVQTQSVSSSPPPASQPPSTPVTATPPMTAASTPPTASTPPPTAAVPPPMSSSDAIAPPMGAATPPATSVPPTAPPTAASSTPPASSPPAASPPVRAAVLEQATFTPPPTTATAVPPPATSTDDPRDKPCASGSRTSSGSGFTCSGWNGYYCNANSNGQTGTSTCGGTWRCESISSEPSVYGVLAAYPSSNANSAIGGYCHTSSDCSAGQFCDKSPQTNWAGDRSYGNCVAYLAQGCMG